MVLNMENYKQGKIIWESMLIVAVLNIMVLFIIAMIITYVNDTYRYYLIYGWILLMPLILIKTINELEKQEVELENRILLFLKEIVTHSTTEEISINLKEKERKIARSIKCLLLDGSVKKNLKNNTDYEGQTYVLVNV